MNKTAKIIRDFSNWRQAKITIDEIAKKYNTPKKYVYAVFNKETIKMNYGEEKHPTGGLYLHQEFSIQEVLKSLESCTEIMQLIPKVNELPNGKVRVIYQSKMNL